jgi:hypothetical protein
MTLENHTPADEARVLLRRVRATALLLATHGGAELLDSEAINSIGDQLQSDVERVRELIDAIANGAAGSARKNS